MAKKRGSGGIWKARTGWVVDFNGYSSAYQALVEGARRRTVLIPFCEQFPENMDLDAPWNEWTSNREALRETGVYLETARTLEDRGRVE